MKILRYVSGGESQYGILEEDGSILALDGNPFGEFRIGPKILMLPDVKPLAPVEPSKIIGVGLNYKSHIREMGLATPKIPMLFMKPSTSIINQDDSIIYPLVGKKVEHEGELAVIIGKPAKHVPEETALDYVLGYTCGNDVSERVIQFSEMEMGATLIGKGFDTFCPLGPVIATELDPTDLNITTRVNGKTRQNGKTSDLLFPVSKLVSYITKAITLLPGDVILTGTPSGVGPISDGDIVEVEISGIGVLRNQVKSEKHIRN